MKKELIVMEKIKEFAEKHDEKTILYLLIGFLAGVVVGFLFSPIKRGITIGSYNGANNKFVDSNNITKKSKK